MKEAARAVCSRRAMAGAVLQVRYPTGLTDEEYVTQRAWNGATAPPCPWCAPGRCTLVPHGFYPRVQPQGTLIRRFRCRRQGRTVSLLPDCLAAHVRGSLEDLEAAAGAAEQAATRAAAAEQIRPPGQGSLVSAQRWLGRRVQWVRVLLVTVKGLCPERFTGVDATLAGFGQALDSDTVLRALRDVAETHLQQLAAPVGFGYPGVPARVHTAGAGAKKQYMGLDPPPVAG
jgi:hypothetical protein